MLVPLLVTVCGLVCSPLSIALCGLVYAMEEVVTLLCPIGPSCWVITTVRIWGVLLCVVSVMVVFRIV